MYANGGTTQVASARDESDRLVLEFDDYRLGPGDEDSLVFRTIVKQGAPEGFRVLLERTAISAVFTSGPQAGQAVSVSSPSGQANIIANTFATIDDRSAQGSFKMRFNPFNPLEADAEFKFYLPKPSKVEFRIFTLTGEEVLSRIYPAGDLSPGAGDQMVTLRWDGRNEQNELVLNGVYIAWLRIVSTGDEATLKVAVVK